MTCFFRPNLLAAMVLAAIAFSVSGCGRRGPLEPPPSAAASNAPLTGRPDETHSPTSLADAPGEDAAGAVAAPEPRAAKPGPRPFPLDPLL